MAYYISIMGNICSGKSTISKIISDELNFINIPSKRFEMKYLERFFKEPERWFLDTQLSFLISKAVEIKQALFTDKFIVVDRSIDEDIKIFAKFWINNYDISKEAVELYSHISSYIQSSLPDPDIIIQCNCTFDEIEKRFGNRDKRNFEKFYPENYIQTLQQNYINYFNDIQTKNLLKIDSNKINLTKKTNAVQFARELKNILIEEDFTSNQFELFDSNNKENKSEKNNIIEIPNKFRARKILIQQTERLIKQKQIVYIAAPFTAFATENPTTSNLFPTVEYGIIPKSYKNSLLEIENQLKKMGLNTFLPHRDVNKWGESTLTSSEVMNGIIEGVSKSDFLISIPSNSIGVHTEIGIAMAQNKKIVIFDIEELNSSFFVEGFKVYKNSMYIKCKNLDEVVEKFKSFNIYKFLVSEET